MARGEKLPGAHTPYLYLNPCTRTPTQSLCFHRPDPASHGVHHPGGFTLEEMSGLLQGRREGGRGGSLGQVV